MLRSLSQARIHTACLYRLVWSGISGGSLDKTKALEQIWKHLPQDVTSAKSLSTFRQRLKTQLFTRYSADCFLDIRSQPN